MTSHAGRWADSASSVSDGDREALRKRAVRFDEIIAGALPTTSELQTGLPFCGDSLQSDVMAFIDSWREGRDGEINADLAVVTELARANAELEVLQKVRERAAGSNEAHNNIHDAQLADRADVWLAYLGDGDAQRRVIKQALRVRWGFQKSLVTETYRLAFAVGLPSRGHGEYDFGDADKLMSLGMQRLVRVVPMIKLLESTVGSIPDDDPRTGLQRLISRLRMAPEEPEPRSDTAEAAMDGDTAPGMVVVPALPTTGTSWRKEIDKTWSGLAGVALPLVTRGDLASHRLSLVAQWPHAAEVIDTVLGDLATREVVRFRPTLLVGAPGSGKSSLARAICDVVGLPCELQSFAGLHDAALMGTSAQWGSAREAAPLQLIKRSGVANPGIIWDEIEKASVDRRNGAPAEALLAMLEVDQARRYRDLCLEVECDLSMVSHFATANELGGIPAPVLDRMRVLQMPEPGWQHLHVLTRQIRHRIAAERGVDERWYGALAEDEMDLVRAAWPGGSIRKLTTIVRAIIDGRDRFLGRC